MSDPAGGSGLSLPAVGSPRYLGNSISRRLAVVLPWGQRPMPAAVPGTAGPEPGALGKGRGPRWHSGEGQAAQPSAGAAVGPPARSQDRLRDGAGHRAMAPRGEAAPGTGWGAP